MELETKRTMSPILYNRKAPIKNIKLKLAFCISYCSDIYRICKSVITVTEYKTCLWLVCTICASRAMVRAQPVVFHISPRPSLFSSSPSVRLKPTPASTHTAASPCSQKRSTCRKWHVHRLINTPVVWGFFFSFRNRLLIYLKCNSNSIYKM